MSSPIEEPALVPRLAQLSVRAVGLSVQDMLEVLPDQLIARMTLPGVRLEVTGDAYEQFMQSLMPLHSLHEQGLVHHMELSIQLLLPAESVPSSSSTPESNESSIMRSTVTPEDWSC